MLRGSQPTRREALVQVPLAMLATMSSRSPMFRRMISSIIASTSFATVAVPSAHARGLSSGVLPGFIRGSSLGTEWPFQDEDFARADERPDSLFYSFPRIRARHIDEDAVAALKRYMANVVTKQPRLRPGNHQSNVVDLLDLCASFESYLPDSWAGGRRIAGLGLNEEEMLRNPELTESIVFDLNDPSIQNTTTPILPYENETFDVVLCALSIDYLIYPREILRDVARILRPGGLLCIAFSDRVFASKAINMWNSSGDADHIWIVANYVHFAGGFANEIGVYDLSPRVRANSSDPLYVIEARKA